MAEEDTSFSCLQLFFQVINFALNTNCSPTTNLTAERYSNFREFYTDHYWPIIRMQKKFLLYFYGMC